MIGFINLFFEGMSEFDTFFNENDLNIEIVKRKHTAKWELKTEYISHHLQMKSTVYDIGGSVSGSLQNFYNTKEGLYNYDDLSHSQICKAIDFLTEVIFEIDKAKVTKLEFGINFPQKILCEDLINSNILMHKLNGYNHNKKEKIKGVLKYFEYTDFHFLAYNKAIQFYIKGNTLRIELRLVNSVEIKKVGILILADLKDKSKLVKLFELFMRKFEELTIIDKGFENLDIPEKDKAKLNNYISPAYWKSFSIKTRQNKHRNRKNFDILQKKYNLNNTKNQLRYLLEIRFKQLLDN